MDQNEKLREDRRKCLAGNWEIYLSFAFTFACSFSLIFSKVCWQKSRESNGICDYILCVSSPLVRFLFILLCSLRFLLPLPCRVILDNNHCSAHINMMIAWTVGIGFFVSFLYKVFFTVCLPGEL